MRKIKKIASLGLCLAMVMSIGIGANAASFNFYVDSVGDSSVSTNVYKTSNTSYATVNLTTLNYNGPSGGLLAKILADDSTAVTSTRKPTKGSGQTWSYKSGYVYPGLYHCIYAETTVDCGYGAILAGTWTP